MSGLGRKADGLLSGMRVAIADVGRLPAFPKGSNFENGRVVWWGGVTLHPHCHSIADHPECLGVILGRRMLRSIPAFVALAVSGGAAQAQPPSTVWSRVYDQHGSSFEIPGSAVNKRSVRNDLVYTAEGGRVRITFSTITEARSGFPGNNPQGDMNLKRSDCTTWPPSYHVVKERLAAYSCLKGDAVTYYVARYSPWGSVTLQVTYPKKEGVAWGPAIERMSSSMRQVKRKEIP
jgi:hypothetical protein